MRILSNSGCANTHPKARKPDFAESSELNSLKCINQRYETSASAYSRSRRSALYQTIVKDTNCVKYQNSDEASFYCAKLQLPNSMRRNFDRPLSGHCAYMNPLRFHESIASFPMNPNFVSTDAEHEIIETARRKLGRNLSTFLLAGYGETYETKKRAFKALKYEPGAKTTYQFETINDGELGLPFGKSPAVFAALLCLCSPQSERIGEVLFDAELIVRMLGWADLPDARLLIEHAVEQYFSTGYYKVSEHLPKYDLLDGRYSRYIRLVEYYKTFSEILNDDPATETLSIFVRLAPGFIEGIATEQKYFFDMDFEDFTSFRQVK